MCVFVMHHFDSRLAITFRSIQDLTTLLDQQQFVLNDLVASFIDDVGAIEPFTSNAFTNLDALNYVISNSCVVTMYSVQKFVNGMTSWTNSIVDKVNQSQ